MSDADRRIQELRNIEAQYQQAYEDEAIIAGRAPKKLRPGKDAALRCAHGTPWLDHFQPPVGTGLGCKACHDYEVEARGVELLEKMSAKAPRRGPTRP